MFCLVLFGLFILLGIFLGNKLKDKKFIDNLFFGFLLIILIINLLPSCYYLLSNNYHDTSFIYLIFMIIIGFLIKGITSCFDNEKCYSFVIMFVFYNFFVGFNLFYSFNFSFVLFNCLYYIIIGLYISNVVENKKIVCVLLFIFNILGYLVAVLFNNIAPRWIFGLIFSINIGIIISYIYYLMKNIFNVRSSKSSMIGLIIGMFIVLMGVLL